MQLTLRPYVTTGIALVGASVIAISPISPVTPDLHVPTINVSSAAVKLAAVVNPTGDPFSAWFNTAITVVEGAVGIGGQVLGNGTPVLTQILANQMGYLNQISTAVTNTILGLYYWEGNTQWLRDYAYTLLQEGKIGEAFSWGVVYPLTSVAYALYPLLNLMSLPGEIAQNFANVAKALPRIVTMLGNSGISAIASPLNAFGGQLQGIADAVNAGDPLGVLNAVLNIPAAMTNAFLGNVFRPYTGEIVTGLIGALVVGIPNIIASVIKPPAPPAPPAPFAAAETAPDTLAADTSSISNTAISALGGAGTLTVSLESKVEAPETPAAKTPAEEAPAEETPATETPVDETPVDSEPSEDDDTPGTGTGTGTGTGNGATDLSGGNKVTPGQTHSNTKGSDSGSADTDAPESPADDESAPSGANSGAATGTGSSSDSDSSGSSDSGDSDSGDE